MNENMDTSTPIGRAMLGIMSAFAQLERETIRERTRMGMKERVKSGYWPGGGKIPFGYDYSREQGILVPNEDAETVKKVYELYLDGYSADKIAALLGLPYPHLVTQILKRKTNAGYIVYNGTEYKGKHTPIISLQTYEETEREMRRRQRQPVSSGGYLLTGLLVCGKCGSKMRYQKWGKTGCKIVCYALDKSKRYFAKAQNCNNLRPDAWEIEDIVLQDLFSLSVGKIESGEEKEDITALLRAQLGAARTKLRRLYDLYGDRGDAVLLDTIAAQKKSLEALEEQIRDREALKEKARAMEETKEKIGALQEGWDYLSMAEKKKVVRSLVEKIVITDHVVDIYYTFEGENSKK